MICRSSRAIFSFLLVYFTLNQALAGWAEGAYGADREVSRERSNDSPDDDRSYDPNTGRGLVVDLNGSDFGQFGRRLQNAGKDTHIRSSSRAGTFGSEAVYIDNTSVMRSFNPDYYTERDARMAERQEQRERMDRNAARLEARRKSDDRKERRREARAQRLAQQEARMEQQYRARIDDPWAAYRDNEEGEFGVYVGDYQTHVDAMTQAQQAITDCPLCADSNWSDDDAGVSVRRAVLNSTYARSIHNNYEQRGVTEERRSIPAGPMAAAAKYRTGRENGDVAQYEQAIDDEVIKGRATFYYPGQIPIPDKNQDAGTATQKLGLQQSLLVVTPDSDEYFKLIEAMGLERVSEDYVPFGRSIPGTTYPGGVVVMNNHLDPTSNIVMNTSEGNQVIPIVDPNNGAQVASLMHEMSHAGEVAIVNLRYHHYLKGYKIPDEVNEGADTAYGIRIGTEEDGLLMVDVNDYSQEHGETVESGEQYVNLWTEVMAYSNQYPDAEENIALVGRTLQSMNLSPDVAAKVARDIVESRTYKEMRAELDTAAEHFLEDR